LIERLKELGYKEDETSNVEALKSEFKEEQ
jgi:hypothetical protein